MWTSAQNVYNATSIHIAVCKSMYIYTSCSQDTADAVCSDHWHNSLHASLTPKQLYKPSSGPRLTTAIAKHWIDWTRHIASVVLLPLCGSYACVLYMNTECSNLILNHWHLWVRFELYRTTSLFRCRLCEVITYVQDGILLVTTSSGVDPSGHTQSVNTPKCVHYIHVPNASLDVLYPRKSLSSRFQRYDFHTHFFIV